MGYSESAKQDDDRKREILHACLPVEGVTMLPIIETEQANRPSSPSLATRGLAIIG